MAGTVLTVVTGGAKVGSAEDLAAAFAKTPDQQKFIADLKAGEQQFALQMKQLEINSVDDLAKIMVGTLGTAWVGVTSYYFGSSRGSDRKTELLAGAKVGQ